MSLQCGVTTLTLLQENNGSVLTDQAIFQLERNPGVPGNAGMRKNQGLTV